MLVFFPSINSVLINCTKTATSNGLRTLFTLEVLSHSVLCITLQVHANKIVEVTIRVGHTALSGKQILLIFCQLPRDLKKKKGTIAAAVEKNVRRPVV